jgi:5'-nucleotidase
VNTTSLIPFVKEFLQSLSNVKYDVLIALTHLDLSTDIELAENIPEIDLILGGHEHENYYLSRGSQWTPISKADANAFTVYIHRCAFNLNTKQFRVYSTLSKITPELNDEPKTNEVVNYWFNLGMRAFEDEGYKPNRTVSCLPENVELDGRSLSVRTSQTLLSKHCCDCMIDSTSSSETTVGLFDSGSIRIDDILRGTINEYDVLCVLPYRNNLFALSVPGEVLANALIHGTSLRGSGMFVSYSGVETQDNGKTWLINGTDISKSGLRYNVATMDFARQHIFNDTSIIILKEYKITQTASLINYLSKIYPPC